MNVDASALANPINMYNMNISQFVRVKGAEEQSIGSNKAPANNTSVNTTSTPIQETTLSAKPDVALPFKPVNSLPPVEQVSTQNILELTREAKITNSLSSVDTSQLIQNYGNDNVVKNSLSTVTPLVMQANEEVEPTTLKSPTLAPTETQTPNAALNDEPGASAKPTMNQDYFDDIKEDGVYSIKTHTQEELFDGMTENEVFGFGNSQPTDTQSTNDIDAFVNNEMERLGMTRDAYEEWAFGNTALFG